MKKNYIFLKIHKSTVFLIPPALIFCILITACTQKRQDSSVNVTFINQDKTLDPKIQEGLTEIVHKVYPQLMKDFNKDARTDIAIKIDTTYDGVAFANDGQVTISSKWLHAKPEDLDLITHEVMHIIQAYPNGSGPGWLTEGIADYVRAKYGVDNKGAGWSMTPFDSSQHYTNSYRITARFLTWISQKYDDQIVFKLDNNLRNKTYSADLWKKYTGKTLDQLWETYSKDPTIS
ncbi:MAG: basic secretory protein-like protein [Leeuwenhoekiella sp.]